MRFRFSLLAAAFVITGGINSAQAQDVGVSADKILIGSSVALTGPLSEDGKERVRASEALFKRINSQGGILGRKIEFTPLDDGYDPKRAAENTKQLISETRVFALLNHLGSPTCSAALPIIDREKALFFGPITGADFTRVPVHPTVFNVRASYRDEAEALIGYAVDQMGIKDIGLVFQDDALGQAGKSSLNEALSSRGLHLKVSGGHKRNEEEFMEALDAMIKSEPKAVVLWTVGPAAVKFMEKAAAKNFKALFLTPSPAGAFVATKKLGPSAEGLVFALNFPPSTEVATPIIKRYQDDMIAAGYKEFSALSVEAYINAALLVKGIETAGKDLTRAKVISALEAMKNVDLGGLKFSYDTHNHQATKNVYLRKVSGGANVPAK